ncbi:UNVERIFIED_CONTAM: hypothetical protein Sradi_7118200 [Sesamum radiatum]|uniref:Endonuclease/exonuclease/phosphatase domain-containing protein n=1 Tax=Sesamum radiatum TaxID=300843 RepID=A0AAW2IZW0_SESRA
MARNELIARREMWQGLIQISRSITDEPWMVMGDFNAVLDDSEVSGNAADTSASMAEFSECITDSELHHYHSRVLNFTWHNCSDGERSLWKRLDRMLVNEAWLAKWPQSKYISTNPRTSDHSPLILQSQDSRQKATMFRFENYMTKLTGFQHLVGEHWKQQFTGTDMYILTRKLKSLKPVLRSLRRTHGDLSQNVKQAAQFLQQAQRLTQDFKHESILLQLEKCCRMIFCKATIMEVNMLKQRAKLAWLKGGDNCSKIFFRKITARRAYQRVYQIQNDDGHILTEDALFDINEDSAPGPDGFFIEFKATWAVIGRSISDNVLLAQELLSGYNQKKLPPRCTIKVDLQKAYDMVDWDYLLAVLRLFRFTANAQKSQVLFSKSATQVSTDSKYIWFSTRYTSSTLFRSSIDNSKLSLADCAPLILKIEARIAGWNQLKLTYAGRTQLIKSVLSSIISIGALFSFYRKVGDGTDFKLWLDPWHPDGTLIHRYPHGPLVTGLPLDSPLSTVIVDGHWNWPSENHIDINEIINKLPAIHSGAADNIVWKSSSGTYSTKDAYELNTTDEGESTMEKLKAEFNIKEFFELASRVIDDGDSESMEVLKNLKNKWMKKLGGELNLAGNGGFRPVHTRTPTSFPVPTSRPARRVILSQKAEQAAPFSAAPNCNSAAPISSSVAPSSRADFEPSVIMTPDISSAALTFNSAAPSPRAPWDMEPPAFFAPRASERPLRQRLSPPRLPRSWMTRRHRWLPSQDRRLYRPLPSKVSRRL